MKILIIGDVHFGEHSNKDIATAQLEAAKQIQEWKEENEETYFGSFFCGDIVHNASKISTSQLELEELCFGGDLNYSITGNHDQETDNFFSLGKEECFREATRYSTAKTYIEHSKNFSMLDNNTVVADDNTLVHGIPFYRNAADFYLALEKLVLREGIGSCKGYKDILIIHQTPNTTAFSENCSDTIDINHDLFKPFDLIFCGHIHEPKQLSSKFYQTGSLVPLNRSENTQKYFYIVDTKTLEVTPVPIKTSIEFTEKKRVENNIKLSTQVREKAESFDLQKEVAKYAAENKFTDFQKDFSINLIKKI